VTTQQDAHWRAAGPYVTNNTAKTGLLAETRQFLLAYAELGDGLQPQAVDAAYQRLVDGGLPQRSRATRRSIVNVLQQRLTSWNPPAWVLDDLVAFAQDQRPEVLRSALLIHVPRQDTLLYNVVQRLILPRWEAGDRFIVRADVQGFLDDEQTTHPEIGDWTHATREKLAGNTLTILRDYGLLQGTARKRIVEPVVAPDVVHHLVRLLQAEGVAPTELAHHPDWRLWLWDAPRAQAAIDEWATPEVVP